jgi:hypothetical protein
MTDAIDLSTVAFLNSPNVSAWPVTSEITAFSLRPGSLHLEHTKQDVWPPMPFGEAMQQATLWIFLRIVGQWWGAAVERIRPGQHDKPERAPIDDMLLEWFVHAPWAPMDQHRVAVGERVGFMVTAGNQRLGNQTVVQERSAVVLVHWPWSVGDDYPPFATLDDPPSEPMPPIVPPDVDEAELLGRLGAAIERIIAGMSGVVAANDRVVAKLDEIQRDGVKARFR